MAVGFYGVYYITLCTRRVEEESKNRGVVAKKQPHYSTYSYYSSI